MTQTVTTELTYKAIVQSIPCGLVTINAHGDIDWMNQEASLWLGAEIGQCWRDALKQFLAPSYQDGDEVLLKTGQKVKIETKALHEQNGQLVMLVDVTHSRSIQDKLNQQKRLQALGNMCANLAHQIRNPLCAAKIQVQSLMSKLPKEPKINKVMQNLKSIEDEVNAILLFSRSDKAIVEALDVEQLVMDAIAIANLESKEIMIDFENALINRITIMGNQQGLNGALTNIIGNAIEASSDKACVTISLTERENEVIIEVKDSGHGIEQENLNQIFEPFYTTKAKGTGLGLSISKSIIQNHQGVLTVASKLGQGTTVRIHLPKAAS